MEPTIGIDRDRQNVVIGELAHPIKFGDVLQPNAEYTIRTYTFEGIKGTTADGCLFEIKPHGSTTVMRVIDETVRIQEIAVKGRGWFLGINPNGDVITQEVGDHLEENPLVEQFKGWIGVWIAGEEGLEVLDVTEPPFNPVMETPVERADQTIPPEYWEQYDGLKTPAK